MSIINSKLPHVGTTIFSTMSALAAKHGALNLSQGFPDFATPARLLQQLNHHALAGQNQYPPMSGVADLRSEIAKLVARCYQREVCPEQEITVTSGATEALFVAIHTLIQAGDEVIMFDPAYDSYEPAIALAGGRCKRLALSPPDYRPDWQQVADAITDKTRCIIVNSPHNPTATLLSKQDWLQLEKLVLENELFLISDEVYEHIVFDEHARLSANSFPDLASRSFVISSFGKTFHCTGWKTGYCVAPKVLSREFRKIHQFVTFTSFTPAQHALADMLAEEPEHIDQLGAFYQQQRDYFASEMAAIPLSVFYETPPDSKIIRFCFAKQHSTLQAAAKKLCLL